MTVAELIRSLSEQIVHGTPSDTVVRAWDPEFVDYMPVTGFVTSARDKTLDIQTDDPT